jgi:hypothetical protein
VQSGANAQLRDPQRANGVVTLRPGATLDIVIEYTGLAANRADLINKASLTSATDQDAVFGDIANGATFTFQLQASGVPETANLLGVGRRRRFLLPVSAVAAHCFAIKATNHAKSETQWIYAGRTAGGDRNHRHSRSDVAARGAKRTRGGAAAAMQQ